MKKFSLLLTAMIISSIYAAEINIDGNFDNFNRSWAVSSKRLGTAELVRDNGVNFVQIASENNRRGQVGIYTARGIPAERGARISVSADVQGGPMMISVFEYGDRKFILHQDKKFEKSAAQQTYKADFTVEDPDTDIICISFGVRKGATAIISNVKVCMDAAGESKK